MPHASDRAQSLPKAPTGIAGLDEITRGGFPRGRPTLICGSAGCGKTLLATEFLIRGALEYGEPGVRAADTKVAPSWRISASRTMAVAFRPKRASGSSGPTSGWRARRAFPDSGSGST